MIDAGEKEQEKQWVTSEEHRDVCLALRESEEIGTQIWLFMYL